MLVKQILNSKPINGVETISPGTTVAQAAEMLSTKRIGALVVSEDGETLGGILSERDVVRELGRRGAACLSETVDGIMTSRITTCTEDETADSVLAKMTDGRFRHMPETADSVLAKMTDRRFRHMPVLDGSKMVGLISIGDVVKARLSELAMERDALEGMVMGH